VFYVGTDSSQTPLQFVDILYRSLTNAILYQPLYFVVDWIQVWCTRVDGRINFKYFSFDYHLSVYYDLNLIQTSQ